jgi:transposase
MRPRVFAEVPEQTVAVARAAFRKPTLAMRVRDELGEVFADQAFLDAFVVRGRPGVSPGQLVMVTVLQFAENLTDRQAADAVRGRIDWKYGLGLELTDPGFDFSVLSQFRRRCCIVRSGEVFGLARWRESDRGGEFGERGGHALPGWGFSGDLVVSAA